MDAKQASSNVEPTKPVESPQKPKNDPYFVHYNADP